MTIWTVSTWFYKNIEKNLLKKKKTITKNNYHKYNVYSHYTLMFNVGIYNI